MGNTKGFTLLELMMALVVIAILVSVSYPAYIEHVENARRADGIGALLTLATKQEKYHYNAGSYTNDMTQLGYAADPALSPESFYRIDATLIDAGQNFTLTATRYGVQVHDTKCGDLILTSTGIKSAVNNSSSNPLEECWQ